MDKARITKPVSTINALSDNEIKEDIVEADIPVSMIDYLRVVLPLCSCISSQRLRCDKAAF
jgi:hypothetical protein